MRLLTLGLGLVACQADDDGPLADESHLDRQRILGARVEVGGTSASEAAVGDVVSVQILAWSPTGEPSVLAAWCPPVPAGGCPSDELVAEAQAQDLSSPDAAAWAQEAGVLGVVPDLPVTFPIPPLGTEAPRTYLPVGLAAWSPDEPLERASFTLVVVDDAVPRNQNPGPPGFTVDEALVEGPLSARRGATLRLDASPAEAPETFADEGEPPVEEIYVYRWYSDLGELAPIGLEVPLGAAPRPSVDWALPDEDADGVLLLVVRDGRGGMAWTAVDVEVR